MKTKPPFIVVITGGIASGKSIVGRLFAQWGARVIDTDTIAHELTQKEGKALPKIREVFGEAFAPIHAPEGLDRAKMRAHVFAHKEARKQLESILHPMIREAQNHLILEKPFPLITAIQIPLFVETGAKRSIPITSTKYSSLSPLPISRVLMVETTEAKQLARIIEHRSISKTDALHIINAQVPASKKRLYVDDILGNIENIAKLQTLTQKIFQEYTQRAIKFNSQ